MLPKPSRLNLKQSFKWVRSGRSYDNKYARIFTRAGENTFPRVGISTSSKVFKQAVDRNRSRRLLSKAIEMLYPLLPQNINIILLPKSEIIEATSNQVYTSLKETLRVES